MAKGVLSDLNNQNDALHTTFRQLSELIRQDLGCRGFAGIVTSDDMEQAAVSLMTSGRVLIATGFCVLDKMIGETDGPPGALVLGYALAKLGKEVLLVTDKYSSPLLKAGMSCYQHVFNITEIPADQQRANVCLKHILDDFKPDHIVSIERPGQAADGHCYSMRGEQLNLTVPILDTLFTASSSDTRTIAIGDGGNELGMGGVYDLIKAHVPLGEKIGCVTPADFLIPAGVSNWAGYGLAAALSFISGLPLLPDDGTEVCVLKAMVQIGAVDGCTKQNELSVDGIPFEQYLHIIQLIYQLTASAHGVTPGQKG
jgi:hypothetical protein